MREAPIVLVPVRAAPVALFIVAVPLSDIVAADNGGIITADDGGYIQIDQTPA